MEGSKSDEEQNLQTSRTSGSNSSFALKGTIRTFVGAMIGGSDRTCYRNRSIIS
jgi:hypothetical protein